MAKGLFVEMVNFREIQKKMSKQSENAKKALKSALYKTKGTVNAAIAPEIKKVYSGKKLNIKATNARLQGSGSMLSIGYTYKGGLLTMSHFKYSGGRRTKSGQGKMVSVDIKKAKKDFPGAFVIDPPKGPRNVFRRTGKKTKKKVPYKMRYRLKSGELVVKDGKNKIFKEAIEPVKTLSMPQMILEESVSAGISKKIGDAFVKNLEHAWKHFAE